MDRAETAGLGVAAAGHVLLFAALSLGFMAAPDPLKLKPQPIDVQLIDEVGLESGAPAPSLEEPAPKLAEIEGPIVDSAPPPPQPLPDPVPQPQPRAEPAPPPAPTPKPVKRAPAPKPTPAAKAAPARPKAPAEKAAPAKAAKQKAATRPTGRLSGILDGVSERESQSRATTPRTRTASAAVQSSLRAEVLRQLKPHWKAPTGADAEQLRTELSITLAPNGTVTNIEVLRTTGQTPSNRPQVKLHQEQAIRAARLASPFRLPAEYYDAWKLLSPIGFDKRLSQ